MPRASKALRGATEPRLHSPYLKGKSKVDDVIELANLIKLPLLPWQEFVLRDMLRVDKKGRVAAFEVLVFNTAVANLVREGVEVQTGAEVRRVRRSRGAGKWQLKVKDLRSEAVERVTADFVFVGAGGWALKMLQRSGIKEAKGYGTFPVSGEFLKTSNPKVVAAHQAKVYSQAAVGAPPMSVPHLDTRVVDGEKTLLFGPYAGLNPKFLKQGSILDLPLSVRLGNLIPYLAVAVQNVGLIKYLLTEISKSTATKFESLREFVPNADPADWEPIQAGQRAQVIKKDPKKGGVLQFGTEVVSAADGSIAGLLGASPGASTAV